MSKEELKSHVRDADTWSRGLFILLFAVFYSIAEIVLAGIVLFQFGSQLFTGRTNTKLEEFCLGLNAYFYQMLQFFTYRSDIKPYPFSDWPREGIESVQHQESEVDVEVSQEEVEIAGEVIEKDEGGENENKPEK